MVSRDLQNHRHWSVGGPRTLFTSMCVQQATLNRLRPFSCQAASPYCWHARSTHNSMHKNDKSSKPIMLVGCLFHGQVPEYMFVGSAMACICDFTSRRVFNYLAALRPPFLS